MGMFHEQVAIEDYLVSNDEMSSFHRCSFLSDANMKHHRILHPVKEEDVR